ncbi:unnamed protein product [Phaeothamnion confervicola]
MRREDLLREVRVTRTPFAADMVAYLDAAQALGRARTVEQYRAAVAALFGGGDSENDGNSGGGGTGGSSNVVANVGDDTADAACPICGRRAGNGSSSRGRDDRTEESGANGGSIGANDGSVSADGASAPAASRCSGCGADVGPSPTFESGGATPPRRNISSFGGSGSGRFGRPKIGGGGNGGGTGGRGGGGSGGAAVAVPVAWVKRALCDVVEARTAHDRLPWEGNGVRSEVAQLYKDMQRDTIDLDGVVMGAAANGNAAVLSSRIGACGGGGGGSGGSGKASGNGTAANGNGTTAKGNGTAAVGDGTAANGGEAGSGGGEGNGTGGGASSNNGAIFAAVSPGGRAAAAGAAGSRSPGARARAALSPSRCRVRSPGAKHGLTPTRLAKAGAAAQ